MKINSDNNIKKIGLYGGTFDPIHIGHIIIAEWVLDYLNLDYVIFIPNKVHPFTKRKDISASEIRKEMISKVVERFEKFDLSDVELQRKGVSYTIDTIRYFRNKFPDVELHYIMGEDNLEKFDKWKNVDEIINLCKVVIFKRSEGQKKINFFKDEIIILDNPIFNISSTEIRNRIKSEREFQSLLYPSVYEFILEKKIYK